MSDRSTASQALSIYPILSVNFVGTLGFSIVLPFLVFLVTRWGGNAFVYGIMGATYSMFQLLGAPILGRWSDRYGRRKILLLSQLGTLFSWAVFLTAFALPTTPIASVDSRLVGQFALTLPLIIVFVARAADGLTGGNVSVANAYLADITSEEDRSRNFGKMAVSANLGFILGPAIAGVLGGTGRGELLPVLAALCISLAATLIIAFRLPESKPCAIERDPEQLNVRRVFGQEQTPCFDLHSSDTVSMRDIVRLDRVSPLLLAYFMVMLGFNFFYIAFPVYARASLVWSVREVGIYFSILSLSMVIVQGPVLHRVSRKASDTTLALAGSLILTASFLFFMSNQTRLLYAGAVLLALGNGLMWPSIVSMLSKAAGDSHQGAVQGYAGSLGAVASVLGLLIGGVLYESFGARVFGASSVSILTVSAICLWLASSRSIGTGQA